MSTRISSVIGLILTVIGLAGLPGDVQDAALLITQYPDQIKTITVIAGMSLVVFSTFQTPRQPPKQQKRRRR